MKIGHELRHFPTFLDSGLRHVSNQGHLLLCFFHLVVLHGDIVSFAEAFQVLAWEGGTSFEKPCIIIQKD